MMGVAQFTARTDTNESALDIVGSMASLASRGEWRSVEQLAVRLRHAILDVPEKERRSVLLAVNRHLEELQTVVLTSRAELQGKLSAIHRGRIATRAYGQPDLRHQATPSRNL